MLLYYIALKKPFILLLAYILQAVPYCLLLKKAGIKPVLGLLPTVAEYKLSRKVFRKRRTFFRPLILSVLVLACACYIGPFTDIGICCLIASFLPYGIFLAVLYGRLAKAYGKKGGFIFGEIVLPPIFLTVLARGQAEFTAPEFRPEKPCTRKQAISRNVLFAVFSVLELAVILAVCGGLAFWQHTPSFLARELVRELNDDFRTVEPTGDIVTREDTLGADLAAVADANRSRDYYYPDHSEDESVTVFVYIIGSDLENRTGQASANILQMLDATEQGSGLRFIIETGGSKRWMTRGIANGSYGRYEIADGKLTKLESLPDDTDMNDWQVLSDFLCWGIENYSADRNMLILWDHGGGVAFGYGQDDVNGEPQGTIQVSELVQALAQGGMTYDVIGFDACLMQDIEIADAVAPFADYYIASEEEEGANGWPYTYAFGSLAADPGMSTEDFAETLIACNDPYNAESHSGVVQTGLTLSVIDLTLVQSAYDRLAAYFADAAERLAGDPEYFADLSLAASGSYDFHGYQLDLLDFLTRLDALDYSQSAAEDEEMKALIRSLQACVVYRNGASADGINGIAFAFPYNNTAFYDSTEENLESLSLTEESHAFNVFFSIMAAQQMRSAESVTSFTAALAASDTADYTQKDWYIQGFEDYDDAAYYADIPLVEAADGYLADLPEDTWDIITDVQTMVWQQVEDDGTGAVLRCIGSDYLSDANSDGHTLIAPDDCWVRINGRLVCYEADQVLYTGEGETFIGRVPALLNNSQEISLVIQWNTEEDGLPETAVVLGYTTADDSGQDMPDKGYRQLEAGDTLRFLFDYYDAYGNYLDTRADGSPILITAQDRLEVTDSPLDPCTLEFCGVLQDIYGRRMTTETVLAIITE